MKSKKINISARLKGFVLALIGAGCLAVAGIWNAAAVYAVDGGNNAASTEVGVGVTEQTNDVSLEIPLYVTIGVIRSKEDPDRLNKVLVPEGYGIENKSYDTKDVVVTDIQVEPFTEKDPDQEGKYKLSKWQIVEEVDNNKNERQVELKIGGVQIPTLDRGTEAAPAQNKSIWDTSVTNAPRSQFFDKDKIGTERYPVIGKNIGRPGTTEYKIEADVPANYLPSANGEGGDNYTSGIMKIRYSFSTLVDDGKGNKVIQNAVRYAKNEEYIGASPDKGDEP